MPHPITLAILDHPGLWVALDFDSALSGIRHSGDNAACGISGGLALVFAIRLVVNWSKFSSFWGTSLCRRRSGTWDANSVSATR